MATPEGVEADQGKFYFPTKVLENNKVKLVPFSAKSHAEPFIAGGGAAKELYVHMPSEPFSSLLQLVDGFLGGVVRGNDGMFVFAILDKVAAAATATATATEPPDEAAQSREEEVMVAGMLSLINTSPVNKSTEIGMLVLPRFQRTHVSGNAVGLVLGYLLNGPAGLGLSRVQWQTSSLHEASRRLALRMGFREEGTRRWDKKFVGGRRGGKIGKARRVGATTCGTDRGKEDERQGDGGDEDLWRDTVVYGLCWDDWEGGVREKVLAQMERSG